MLAYKIEGKRQCVSFIELYVVVRTRCINMQYFLVKSNLVVRSYCNVMCFPRMIYKENMINLSSHDHDEAHYIIHFCVWLITQICLMVSRSMELVKAKKFVIIGAW